MKPLLRLSLWGALLLVAGGIAATHAAPGFGPKFGWFDQHKDDFDIIFIGSSRIAHGISPKLFDRLAAERGSHWRSFNLGKDKMKQPECLALARHEASLHPRKLRYLFLELQTPGLGAAPDGAWPNPEGGLGPDGDGYFPIDRSMSDEMRPRYEEFLQAAKDHPPSQTPNPAVRAELGRLRDELKAQGIEVVFVVAPSLRSARGAGVNAPPGSVVFSFADLDRFADLYSEQNRPDAEHLNNSGAIIFTRELVTQFCAALSAANR